MGSKETGWEGGIIRGCEGTFEGNGYIHYLNCGDGFMDGYICQKLSDFLEFYITGTIQHIRLFAGFFHST